MSSAAAAKNGKLKLKHPKPKLLIHATLVYNKKKKCVCYDKDKPLKGILNVISDLFFPNYNYEQAKLRVTPGTKSQEELKGDKEDRKHENVYGKKDVHIRYKKGKMDDMKYIVVQSKKLGKRIEKQFDKTLGWYQKINCPPQTFFNALVKTQVLKTLPSETIDNSRSLFNSACRNLDSFTEGVWEALHSKNLRPIWTQAVIGCPKPLGMASLIDIVCEEMGSNTSRRLVGVELKMKYSYKNHYNGYMNSPFQLFTNSPFHQSCVQSLVSWILFDIAWTGIMKLEDYYIVRIDNNGKEIDKIPNGMLAKRQECFNQLLLHNSKCQSQ